MFKYKYCGKICFLILFLFRSIFISSIETKYIQRSNYSAHLNWIRSNMFLRKNSMITRNGDSRQAERTREYVSIGENRMSVRTNLIFIWWHKFLFGSKYISPIASIYIYAGLKNLVLTVREPLRYAKQTKGLVWMRNPKWKGQFFKLTLVFVCSAPDFERLPQVLPQQTAPERHPRGTHKYILIAASARTWRGS